MTSSKQNTGRVGCKVNLHTVQTLAVASQAEADILLEVMTQPGSECLGGRIMLGTRTDGGLHAPMFGRYVRLVYPGTQRFSDLPHSRLEYLCRDELAQCGIQG